MPGMSTLRVDHLGLVLEDLDAAIGFFTEFGLEVTGSSTAMS